MTGKSTETTINPALLIWARESVGKTIAEASELMEIPMERLQELEGGKEKIKMAELDKAAKIYKRPLAVFFLPAPPVEIPAPVDFRKLPEGSSKPISTKIRLAIRKARRLQTIFTELLEEEGRNPRPPLPKIESTQAGRAEACAEEIRGLLGITIEIQRNWANEAEALNEWRKAIEKLGILVFQISMPVEESRGFSLADEKVPAIILNLRDSIKGRIFSLLHELGHILLDKSGLCNMEMEFGSKGEKERIEYFCNTFAGAVLVPKKEILNSHRIRDINGTRRFSSDELRELSREFKVSQEVILRRLAILGKATTAFYKERREEWLSAERKPKRGGGRMDPPKKCIQDKGVPYVARVINSHREGRITYADIADYLGIRLKHVSRLERLLNGKSAS